MGIARYLIAVFCGAVAFVPVAFGVRSFAHGLALVICISDETARLEADWTRSDPAAHLMIEDSNPGTHAWLFRIDGKLDPAGCPAPPAPAKPRVSRGAVSDGVPSG